MAGDGEMARWRGLLTVGINWQSLMRIATYNVNGINGRLANLLGWLEEAAPDIVCLQELKAPDDKFPAAALRAAGYGAVWHGQKSWNGVAILARGGEPAETRRGLPGDPDDTHSRYIEAAIGGLVVGCLYLPNGNPAPGPKFDYKLRLFGTVDGLLQVFWPAAHRLRSRAEPESRIRLSVLSAYQKSLGIPPF